MEIYLNLALPSLICHFHGRHFQSVEVQKFYVASTKATEAPDHLSSHILKFMTEAK